MPQHAGRSKTHTSLYQLYRFIFCLSAAKMLTRKEELFVKPFQQRLYHQHKIKVSILLALWLITAYDQTASVIPTVSAAPSACFCNSFRKRFDRCTVPVNLQRFFHLMERHVFRMYNCSCFHSVRKRYCEMSPSDGKYFFNFNITQLIAVENPVVT